jgi:hypothetical protein
MAGKWGRSALHSVEELDGVGAQRAQQLAGIGLGTVEEFASLERAALGSAAAVVEGLSERQMMDNLLPQAWFHLLGDDGAAAAAVLVDAGIDNYVKLIAAPASRLDNLLGDDWDRDRVAQLQLAASRAIWCFQVLLQVFDKNGDPRAPILQVGGSGFDGGARVVTRDGDEQGWVISPLLRRDRAHYLRVVVQSQGRSVYVRPKPSQVSRFTVLLARDPRSIDEATLSPKPRLLSGMEIMITERSQLSELAAGTPLQVATIENDVASLLGLYRQLQGHSVVVPEVDVAAAALPQRAQAGSIVVVENQGGIRMARTQEKRAALAARGEDLIREIA